jgi:hypothetical protein
LFNEKDWLQVRYIPASGLGWKIWDEENKEGDKLDGSEVYAPEEPEEGKE